MWDQDERYGRHYFERETRSVELMIACVDANSPTPDHVAEARIRHLGADIARLRRHLVAAGHSLARALRDEALDPTPFSPGRGPVFAANQAIARLQAELSATTDARAAEEAALVAARVAPVKLAA